jgi:hypothetical protein
MRVVREGDCVVLYRFKPENILWLWRCFLENNEERGGALTNKQEMKIFRTYIGDT